MRVGMRILLVSSVWLLVTASGCGGGAASTKKVETSPTPAPAPPGWWVETAETLNPKDVGLAARFDGGGTVLIIPPSSRPQRVAATVTPTTALSWSVKIGEKPSSLFRQDGDLLHGTMGEHRIELRRATADEARRFDAEIVAHPPVDESERRRESAPMVPAPELQP